ncbi:MAG TPA: hypothetical protein VMB03_19835 [Bryobacteraceae bacterium]|nr:hypothetical protein [Bryobacteraceae bacterium]
MGCKASFLAVTAFTLVSAVDAQTSTAGISLQAPSSVMVGNPLAVAVNISGVNNLFAFQVGLMFPPATIAAESTSGGQFLPGYFVPGQIDGTNGVIAAVAGAEIGMVAGVSGNGTLCTIQFMPTAIGSATISIPISSVILLDSNLNEIPFTVTGSTVSVTANLCDIDNAGTVTVTDVQAVINEAFGSASPSNDLNGDGEVNVVDVQLDVDAALGLGCSAAA